MTERKTLCIYCVITFWCVILVILIQTEHSFQDLSYEYLPYDYTRYSCLSSNVRLFKNVSEIPKHIHQIFFNVTDRIIPDDLENARRSWFIQQTRFQYTLWNASMVEKLILDRYPCLWELYSNYGHWIRRADMARYVVLYEYGGVYIDLDIQSSGRDLDVMFTDLKSSTGVLLYLTNPPVVSNDFMASKPQHPFFKSVLKGLEPANKWYVLPYLTTMFSTGPMFLHSQYKSYIQATDNDDIEVIEPRVISRYVRHIEGGAWHQLDGQLIWWIYCHKNHSLIAAILFPILILSLIVILKYQRLCASILRLFMIQCSRQWNMFFGFCMQRNCLYILLGAISLCCIAYIIIGSYHGRFVLNTIVFKRGATRSRKFVPRWDT